MQHIDKKIKKIQEKVQQRAIDLYFQDQPCTIQQIQIVKSFPNLQHYQFNMYDSFHPRDDLNFRQIVGLFQSSSNLSFLNFEYELQLEQIQQLRKFLAEENFNKKLYVKIQSENIDCLNQKINTLNKKKQLKKHFQDLTKQIYFRNLKIKFQSKQQSKKGRSLQKIANIIQNIGSFGLVIKFDQYKIAKDGCFERQLTVQQTVFIVKTFQLLEETSSLKILRLTQLEFSQITNQLFCSVLQSNYGLKLFKIDQCAITNEICFDYINNELESLQLIQVEVIYCFSLNCLKKLTKLKYLYLQYLFLKNTINSLTNLPFQNTLIRLALINMIMKNYNPQKGSSQPQLICQLLGVFSKCSIHSLQIQHESLNPQDLYLLESLELKDLYIRNCLTITDGFLKAINRKWPNLKWVDFRYCKMIIDHPVRAWMVFRNVISITLSQKNSEQQLKAIRLKGKNVTAFLEIL